jgi:peptidoglycan/xylan/chitin deacetylase (PgdA/CDA1 family)
VLAKYQIPATVFVPTGYLGEEPGWSVTKGTSNRPSGRIVSRAELKSVDGQLVKLGSHTVTHPRLATLRPADLRSELAASRRTLEEIIGGPVTMLSLPYGSFNAQVIRAAGHAGYERVFANVPVDRRQDGSGLVGRVNVSPRDWPMEFRLKVMGAYEWLAVAIPAKRLLINMYGRPRRT